MRAPASRAPRAGQGAPLVARRLPAALCGHTCFCELETVESQDHHLGRKQLLGGLPDSTPK